MATIEHVQSKNLSLREVNNAGGGVDTVLVNAQSTTNNYIQANSAREIISDTSSDEEILLKGIHSKSLCYSERMCNNKIIADETTVKSAPVKNYCSVSEVTPVSMQVHSQMEEEDDLLKVENPSLESDKSHPKSMKISKTKKVSTSKGSKKVYDMPGQKKDTPGELDGGRIFYESLRKQKPKSKMAEDYLLKHGLLTYDEATAIVAVQQKSKTKSTASKSGVLRKKRSMDKIKKNKSKTDGNNKNVKKRIAVKKK